MVFPSSDPIQIANQPACPARPQLKLAFSAAAPESRTTLNGTAPPRGSGGYYSHHIHHVVPNERRLLAAAARVDRRVSCAQEEAYQSSTTAFSFSTGPGNSNVPHRRRTQPAELAISTYRKSIGIPCPEHIASRQI